MRGSENKTRLEWFANTRQEGYIFPRKLIGLAVRLYPKRSGKKPQLPPKFKSGWKNPVRLAAQPGNKPRHIKLLFLTMFVKSVFLVFFPPDGSTGHAPSAP